MIDFPQAIHHKASMTKNTKANIAVLTANVIYGINYIAAKEVLPFIHPYALASLRAVGALLLLFALYKILPSQKIEAKDIWRLIIAGIIGVTINQNLLVAGLEYTSSTNASIIMTSNPIIVLLIAAIFLKNKITLTKTLGIGLGISGAIIVIMSRGEVSFSDEHFIGDMRIATNALMYAIYLAWVKPLMKKYDAITVMRWIFVFGGFASILWGMERLQNTDFAAFTLLTWSGVCFIVFCATFLTYLLNIYGLKHTNPTNVSVYIYLQPVIASALALLIGTEEFDYTKLIAFILVATGVYLVSKPTDNPKQFQPEQKKAKQ